ncbi:MAG: type II secretion system F family protein, partial [Campylobacter sp.]
MKKQLEVEYNAKGARRKMFLQANDKVQANNLMKQRVGGTIVKRGETQVVANTGGDFKAQVSRMLGGSGKVRTLPLVASIRQLSVMTNAGISI